MRLLLVTDYYPPLSGGATLAFQQLASRLAALGHGVTVATAAQAGAPGREKRDGVSVERFRDTVSRIPGASADPHRHTPPPFPDPELTWRFRRLLRRIEPDLIYSFGWLTYSLCAALPREHPPLVFSVRDYGNICPKRSLVRHGRPCDGPGWTKCARCAPELYGHAKALVATAGVLGGRRLIEGRVAAVHSCSSYAESLVLENLLHARVLERSKRYVIPDFRDESHAAAPPAGLPTEPFILFVGALRQIKGVGVLSDAYQRMATPKPPLVMIGSRAPDTPHTFPDGIRVLDPVPNPAVLGIWDRALFGVAPSVLPEPLGNVVHEGMSRGKAIIGTTPGGHADMIEPDVSGLLVPAGDVDALATAMSVLAADQAKRERLGNAARQKAHQFSAEVVFPRFVEMFAAEAARRNR